MPERVASPDELRGEARYLDDDGRPIAGAQVTWSLAYEGIEDHAFSAAFDAARGAYVFAWDDMMEWRPAAWREGPHELRVEASDPDDAAHVPRAATVVVTFV